MAMVEDTHALHMHSFKCSQKYSSFVTLLFTHRNDDLGFSFTSHNCNAPVKDFVEVLILRSAPLKS